MPLLHSFFYSLDTDPNFICSQLTRVFFSRLQWLLCCTLGATSGPALRGLAYSGRMATPPRFTAAVQSGTAGMLKRSTIRNTMCNLDFSIIHPSIRLHHDYDSRTTLFHCSRGLRGSRWKPARCHRRNRLPSRQLIEARVPSPPASSELLSVFRRFTQISDEFSSYATFPSEHLIIIAAAILRVDGFECCIGVGDR